jgi:hypothetical protein
VERGTRTFAQWQAEREGNAAWAKLVDEALPPYERRRSRDPVEAKLLRERGTPEHLIGPTAGGER